jgi:hypothetical protein
MEGEKTRTLIKGLHIEYVWVPTEFYFLRDSARPKHFWGPTSLLFNGVMSLPVVTCDVGDAISGDDRGLLRDFMCGLAKKSKSL